MGPNRVPECDPLLAARRSPLAARRSPLAARRSPLAARRSPLAARRSPLAARRSPLAARRSPLAARRSPLAARRSPLAARRSPLAARRSPLAARRSPLAARRSPLAARRSPLAINHPPSAISHQPSAIRHFNPSSRSLRAASRFALGGRLIPGLLEDDNVLPGEKVDDFLEPEPCGSTSARAWSTLILCSGLMGTVGSSARNSTRTSRPPGFMRPSGRPGSFRGRRLRGTRRPSRSGRPRRGEGRDPPASPGQDGRW